MREIKLVKVYYAYDYTLDERVASSVLEGIPWTEVTEEQFKKVKELVKNKHKIKELHEFNLWLIERVPDLPEEELSLPKMLELYDQVTEAEKRAAEKRRLAKEQAAQKKEESDRKKKLALLEKLKKELKVSVEKA